METSKYHNNNQYQSKKQGMSMSSNRRSLKQRTMQKKRQASIATMCIVVALSVTDGPARACAFQAQAGLRPLARSGQNMHQLQKLQYRNADEEQCRHTTDPQPDFSSTQSKQPDSSSPSIQQEGENQPRSSKAQEQRSLETQQPAPHHISGFFHTWFTRAKTQRALQQHELQRKASERSNQHVIDDYLESIDRRYKRLHKDEMRETTGGAGFTNALQWLTHPNANDASSEAEEQRKKEDAIYVLGLAELASASLLQRHHLPLPKSKPRIQQDASVVIDIEGIPDAIENMMTKRVAEASPIITANRKNEVQQVQHSHFTVSTATPSKATLVLTILRKLRAEHVRQCKTLSTTFNKGVFTCLSAGTKLVTRTFALLATLLSTKSGGKRTYQFASLISTAAFAFAISLVRPMTKA